MRKATFPAIAGNPAAGSMKGMIVTVATNVTVDPSAPRTPHLLSQKPRNTSAPNSHSEIPRNQLAPRKRGIEPENERSIADVRDQHLGFVLKPLLRTESEEYEHHRRGIR